MTGLRHSRTCFPNKQAAQHGGNQHGEDQGAQQRERDRPCHGLEEPAFDALQSENRKVGGDDDADGIKYRPLNFMRRFTNRSDGGLVRRCRGAPR